MRLNSRIDYRIPVYVLFIFPSPRKEIRIVLLRHVRVDSVNIISVESIEFDHRPAQIPYMSYVGIIIKHISAILVFHVADRIFHSFLVGHIRRNCPLRKGCICDIPINPDSSVDKKTHNSRHTDCKKTHTNSLRARVCSQECFPDLINIGKTVFWGKSGAFLYDFCKRRIYLDVAVLSCTTREQPSEQNSHRIDIRSFIRLRKPVLLRRSIGTCSEKYCVRIIFLLV